MTQTSQNAKNHPLPCDRCPCSLTYRSKSNFTAYPLSSDDRSAHPLSSFDRSVHLLSSYDRSSLWLTETVIATSGAMRRCWVITKASWRRLRIWSTNLRSSGRGGSREDVLAARGGVRLGGQNARIFKHSAAGMVRGRNLKKMFWQLGVGPVWIARTHRNRWSSISMAIDWSRWSSNHPWGTPRRTSILRTIPRTTLGPP